MIRNIYLSGNPDAAWIPTVPYFKNLSLSSRTTSTSEKRWMNPSSTPARGA